MTSSDLRQIPAAKPIALRRQRKFLNSFYTLSNLYFTNFDEGARAAAEVLNIEYHLDVTHFDESRMKAELEAAPAIGIEAVTLFPLTDATQPDLVRLTNELGLATVDNHVNAAWTTPLDIGPYYVAHHVNNNLAALYAQSVGAFEELGGEGKVILLQGQAGTAGANAERTRGYELALNRFPDITEVGRRYANWSRQEAAPVVNELLAAHPDVNAVICLNDEMAIAAVTALEQRRIRALVTGCDATSDMMDLIEQGRAFSTSAFHPSWLGAYSTVVLFDYLNGWRPSVPERMMYFGGFVLDTPAAAREYRRTVYMNKLPYDVRKMSKVLHPTDWDPGNLLVPIEPDAHWSWQAPKPDGYELPREYAEARHNGEFRRVATMYRERLKTDPLARVLALTRTKQTFI